MNDELEANWTNLLNTISILEARLVALEEDTQQHDKDIAFLQRQLFDKVNK